MASGKSAVGSVISDRLGWTLVDTDDRIVSSLGKSISSGTQPLRLVMRQHLVSQLL